MQEDELSNIIIQPDQSLLLRCRKEAYFGSYPKWDQGGLEMNETKLACRSDSQEVSDQYNTRHITKAWITPTVIMWVLFFL